MHMKRVLLVLTVALLLVFVTGCNKEEKKDPPPVDISIENPLGSVAITITTMEEFNSNLSRWAGHLQDIADRTTAEYDRWDKKELSQEEFIEEIKQINETMQMLKRESDLRTDYEMNNTQEEQAYCDRVLRNYENAMKSLNDFLVLSQELTPAQANQIKELYTSKVLGNFKGDIKLLTDSITAE